jgi:hypothetical protein
MAEEPKSDSKLRAAIIVFFPMFIATLSLVTSIYNGYLNNKFVTLIQGNIGRIEYMRTCRDIIDVYFQVKFRADLLRSGAGDRTEAMNAVSKFGALGTYLANLRDDEIRLQYTNLTGELEKAVKQAGSTQAATRDLFSAADGMFQKLNDDCIKSAHAAPM